MISADFLDAARLYQRVVGFDDPAITGAAMVGLGEALHRLDEERPGAGPVGGGDGAAREPVHVRGLAQRRGRAGAGGRPPGRPGRVPGGRSPRARGRQGGDRLADGLAVQGDRRQGRGRAVLRQGAGRRRTVGGDGAAGRDGGRVAVRGLRGPGRPGAGCPAPARQAGRGRGRAVAARDGHPRPRAPDPDAAAPAVQHVRAVSRGAVRRAAVRPGCLPADLPRDGGRRVARVVRVQRCAATASVLRARSSACSAC